jgi:predicted Zn-dependent protease
VKPKISTIISVLTAALTLANCAQNPVTGNPNFVTMSEAQEVQTGQQEDAKVRKQYGVYDNPALQQYVNEVGQKLARSSHRPGLRYSFVVVDSPEINAFALPGGYIYITRGIMAYLNSEAELAGVLGHEIGHVTARHSVQQLSASTAANVGASTCSATCYCQDMVVNMNLRQTAWARSIWRDRDTIRRPCSR